MDEDARITEEEAMADCPIRPFIENIARQVNEHDANLDVLHSKHRALLVRVENAETALEAFIRKTQEHEDRLMERIEQVAHRLDTLQGQMQESNAAVIGSIEKIGVAVSEYKLNQYKRLAHVALIMLVGFVAYLAGQLDLLALLGVV